MRETRHAMRMTPAHLADMPTEKVVERCRDNYLNLVAVTVADVLHSTTRTSTRRWLRSREMHLDWLDALCGAEAMAQVAQERAAYERSGEAPRHGEQLHRIREVMNEAKALRGRFAQEEFETTREYANATSASLTARGWLVRYHSDEFREKFFLPLLRSKGMEEKPPNGQGDSLHHLERAFNEGLLAGAELPSLKSAQFLLGDGSGQFRDAVLDDVRISERRIAGLRHPLVLRRWGKELAALVEENAPKLAVSDKGNLPDLNVEGLWAMPEGRANGVLGRRRLYLGLRQRTQEREMVIRRYHQAHKANQGDAEAAWEPVREEAVEELVHAYLLQYAHIRARVVAELGLEDGETLVFNGRPTFVRRGKLRHQVFAELDEMGF